MLLLKLPGVCPGNPYQHQTNATNHAGYRRLENCTLSFLAVVDDLDPRGKRPPLLKQLFTLSKTVKFLVFTNQALFESWQIPDSDCLTSSALAKLQVIINVNNRVFFM